MERICDRRDCPDWRNGLFTVLLLVSWLYANFAALAWVWQAFWLTPWLYLVLVGLGVAVVLVQVGRHRDRLGFSPFPVLRGLPLSLLLGAAILAIALRWFWDVDQISVLLFALGSYGLWGLFIEPSSWRKGFPVALLIVCLLPFGTQFGTGLGFPVRVITAHAIERLLHGWGIMAVSANDIIVTENGVARIDLPCSGLRGLWIGTLFLLSVTWLERRQMGWRWLLVYGTALWLFMSTNLVRVLLLVLLTHVFNQPYVAEMLHVPLGLMGFGFACGVGWGLLRWVPGLERETHQAGRYGEVVNDGFNSNVKRQTLQGDAPGVLLKRGLLVGVITGLGIMASLHTPPSLEAIATPQLSPPIQAVSIPLTPVEQAFFGDSEATLAQKWRFTVDNLTGSMLLVSSRSWNAFHPPELCLVGSGLTVDRMAKLQLTKDISARWLSLQDGKLSATYWLQSSHQTTDDFLSRLWEYVAHQNRDWVLVSVLFNQAYQPSDAIIQNFVTTVHQTVYQSLTGNSR